MPGGGSSMEDLPIMLVVFHYFFFLALIMISTCGRVQWGLRLKRTIPRNIIFRCLLFPFYSGAINGIVWLIGIATVLLCSYFLALSFYAGGGRISDTYDALIYSGTWAIMTYAFCTLAMMIRMKLLWRQLTPEHTWLLALALLGGFFAVYFTVSILMSDQRAHYGFYLETPTIEQLLAIAVLWATLATVLFIPWAILQLPKFSPEIEVKSKGREVNDEKQEVGDER
jgi:hypothetical protein